MPVVHCEILFATLCAVSWAEVNTAIVATRRFERKLNFALRLSPSLWTSERNWRKLWTTLAIQFVSSKLRCEMSKKKIGQSERLTSFSFCLFEMCAQETIGYDTGSLITDSFHVRNFFFSQLVLIFQNIGARKLNNGSEFIYKFPVFLLSQQLFFHTYFPWCRGLSGEHYHCIKQAIK